MKSVLFLLSFVAACACEGEVADTAASSNSVPVSADSVSSAADSIPVSADSVLSPTELLSSYGSYDTRYDARGIIYGNGGKIDGDYREGSYRNEGYREGGYRDGGYRNEGYRNEVYRDGGNRDGNYREAGYRDGDYKGGFDGGVYEGVLRENIYDGKDYRIFFVPRLIGRQGLGFQKRNYYSGGMRFPMTPEILEPIGYRPLIKELYFEPLPKYNI